AWRRRRSSRPSSSVCSRHPSAGFRPPRERASRDSGRRPGRAIKAQERGIWGRYLGDEPAPSPKSRRRRGLRRGDVGIHRAASADAGLLGGRRPASGGAALRLSAAPSRRSERAPVRAESEAADMTGTGAPGRVGTARGLRRALASLRALLPHGGSLPDQDWRGRHRVIVVLLAVTIVIVAVYAVAAHGAAAVQYIPEVAAMLAFASLAGWSAASRKWRSVSASMGLLTGSAALVDISGGLIEMHFSFFVVIVVLTLYEDWVPFLVAVAFVLLHHGIMGTIDPNAVFDTAAARANPWAWAGLHALFVALAGVAGVTAWGLNERVRERMRDVQRELEQLGHTDALTGLGNRRRLIADMERLIDAGRPAALAIFDLDGFKEYNDRFGHPAGDALLVRLTAALQDSVAGSGRA